MYRAVGVLLPGLSVVELTTRVGACLIGHWTEAHYSIMSEVELYAKGRLCID
jgi:hypothetical protein